MSLHFGSSLVGINWLKIFILHFWLKKLNLKS